MMKWTQSRNRIRENIRTIHVADYVDSVFPSFRIKHSSRKNQEAIMSSSVGLLLLNVLRWLLTSATAEKILLAPDSAEVTWSRTCTWVKR